MDKYNIYELLEIVFSGMLPDYIGHEKQLELYLINLPNNKLIELAKQYII